MTSRTVASLQADLSTGGISGTANHMFLKDLTDSFLDLAGNNLPFFQEQILWSKVGFDMNVTTDQAFTKRGTYTNFIITAIRFVNASTSLTTAAGGIYDTASKGGTPLVAAAQAYSALTGATIGLDLTLAAYGKGKSAASSLILSLTSAQGGAATADAYILGVPLS